MADAKMKFILELQDRGSKELGKFQSKIKSNQAAIESAGRKMFVFGAAATAGFGVAIKQASDLNESINAVNVIFGDGASEVLKFADNAAKSVGLAKSEFNQLSSVTGALLKDVGLPMKEVAGLTNNLSVRAADMASVMNTDVKDAMSAINQALRGETEAIRRYTGDVTDAALEQFRLAEGMKKPVKEMNEQEKRLLRLQVVMSQTEKFAGDFANTSEEVANKQRIMKAQIKDATAVIGGALLPIYKQILNLIQPIITGLSEWIEANPKLANTLIIITAALGAFLLVAGAVLMVLPGLVIAFGGLSTALAGISLSAITASFLAIMPVLLPVVAAIGLVTLALNKMSKSMSESLTAIQSNAEASRKAAEDYENTAKVLNGADQERAKLQQDLMTATANLQEALAKQEEIRTEKLIRRKLGLISREEKDRIESEKRKADFAVKMAEKDLNATTKTAREKAREMEASDSFILLSAQQTSEAVVRLGEDETRRRLELIEQYEISNRAVQEAILFLQGEVSGETIRLVQAQYAEQQILANTLKNQLTTLFGKPIVQQVLVNGGQAKTEVRGIMGTVKQLADNFVASQGVINESTDKITEGFKGVGGGAGQAKNNIQDFVEKTRSQLQGLIEKISTVRQRIADLTGDYLAEESADRMQLANAIVDTEKTITDLTKQEERAKQAVREATDSEARVSAEQRLFEIQDQLSREQEAFRSNASRLKEFDDEVKEVRRQNSLTGLEKALENFEKERAEAEKTFKEKMQLLQDELSALETQSADMGKIIDDKNKLLLGKYKEDTQNLKDELAEQLDQARKAAEEMARIMRDMQASRSAIGGNSSQRRASGGFVSAGSSYLVGERGRELFVPNVSGNIIPNHKMNNGGVNITIELNGVISSKEVAMEYADLITREIQLSTKGILT